VPYSCYGWLDRAVVDEPVLLQRAEDLRARLRAFKRRPDVDTAGSRKDWGECVTLAYAEKKAHDGPVVLVVTNDDAARALGEFIGLPVATAVDVLRALVADGELTKKQAYQVYRQMVAATVDPGEAVRSAAEL
jgi:predicted nucleic acid-binding protein